MRDNPVKMKIEAMPDRLPDVLAFVEQRLEAEDCSPRTRMQISVVVEEVFINIAMYAYTPNTGYASICMEISGDPATATISFADRGIPYNPLARPDPDLSLSAEEREVGGLGIYMTKQLMDEVTYEYRDGQNVLTLKKKL